MLSVDSETVGIDLHHGSMPFFVTVCDPQGKQTWWEWDVDPLTRNVQVDENDASEIRRLLAKQHDGLILQNSKFDASALLAGGVLDWTPLWELTDDTLISGHLLSSNTPHNLTDMALMYLGVDIEPLELALKAAVTEARRLCRSYLPDWRIARAGLEEMPSAKSGGKKDGKGVQSDAPWKMDMWLPRAVAKRLDYDDGHPWWTVLANYSNADSAVTLPLWKAHLVEMERRGLLPIYKEKMKVLPVLWEMERRGAAYNRAELEILRGEYVGESEEAGQSMLGIAEECGYRLELPKGASPNGSLRTFCFDHLKLPRVANKKAKTDTPSLDKAAIDYCLSVMPATSLGHRFLKAFKGKKRRDTSIGYLESYDKFGVLLGSDGEWAVLYPSVNPTGTDTTRMSMKNPNLQQVSRLETMCTECLGEGCESCGGTGEDMHSIRRVFGPAPGREWWTMDAKNIELRLPAYESGQPELIDLFEHPDDPPFYGSQHMLNMSIVYDDVWQSELKQVGIEKVGPHCKKKYANGPYHWVKCGGLAMQYQCGEDTADATFRRVGGYRKLKAKFSKLDALNRKWVSHAQREGWVPTMPDKSLGGASYPLLCGRSDRGWIVPTTPLNYRVQGTAGWWMVKAMNRCYARLKQWAKQEAKFFDGYIALTVHDELAFDFPRGKNEWRARELQALMEQGGDDVGVPTPVSVSYHPLCWGKGEEL